jgi:hypothetical protein
VTPAAARAVAVTVVAAMRGQVVGLAPTAPTTAPTDVTGPPPPRDPNCPADGALILSADLPWALPDLGVTLRPDLSWRVTGADAQGWHLRALRAPLDLTLAVRPEGAALIRGERAPLLSGWQRRGFTIERIYAPASPPNSLALRLRSPSNRPVRALYIPHPAWPDALLLLTLEGAPGALAPTLDDPERALTERLTFSAPTTRRHTDALAHLASGLTLRSPKPKPQAQLIPTADPTRLAWLDLDAPCPLWAQFDAQSLIGEPPPDGPAALDRLTRDLVGAALRAWPDAQPEPLLPGRLGSSPALRFSLRFTTAQPLPLPIPLPPGDTPQPWSLLGVVIVRPDAPPTLLRAWILGEDHAAAERRFSAWLDHITVE